MGDAQEGAWLLGIPLSYPRYMHAMSTFLGVLPSPSLLSGSLSCSAFWLTSASSDDILFCFSACPSKFVCYEYRKCLLKSSDCQTELIYSVGCVRSWSTAAAYRCQDATHDDMNYSKCGLRPHDTFSAPSTTFGPHLPRSHADVAESAYLCTFICAIAGRACPLMIAMRHGTVLYGSKDAMIQPDMPPASAAIRCEFTRPPILS